MLNGILCVCLLSLSVCSAGSSLSCRWMDHKFRQHSENSLNLLDTMAIYVDAAVENTVAFPNNLYNQASIASDEDKLWFTVQIVEETVALFEEDHSAASWEENTVENFLNVLSGQAAGLHSCIASHEHKKKNKKLHMYFKRLSSHVLKNMDHSAEAWELIRKEVQTHLMRVHQLLSSLLSTN